MLWRLLTAPVKFQLLTVVDKEQVCLLRPTFFVLTRLPLIDSINTAETDSKSGLFYLTVCPIHAFSVVL